MSTNTQTEKKYLHEHISTAIENSRHIYSLKDDWDDDGSKGYLKETWDRITSFLLKSTKHLDVYCIDAEVISISPGPHGSIDFLCTLPNRVILINFPESADEMADFYGDDNSDKPKQKIKGKFDQSEDQQWIFEWFYGILDNSIDND